MKKYQVREIGKERSMGYFYVFQFGLRLSGKDYIGNKANSTSESRKG